MHIKFENNTNLGQQLDPYTSLSLKLVFELVWSPKLFLLLF